MAWTAKISPGAGWAISDAWWAEGTTRWLIVAGNNLGATDDFETYDTSTRPTNPNNGNAGILALGACYDGTRWHVVGDAGYFRSTDGLTGAAWEVSNALNVGSGVHGGRAIAASGGRLVVVSSNGKISLSTDGGDTWVTKRTLFSPGTFAGGYSVAVRGNVWMVSANASNDVSVSTDNGDTWTGYNPLSGNRSHRVGSIPDGAWKASAASVTTANRVTTNNGAAWSNDAYGSRIAEYLTTPGAMYEVVGGVPPTVWSYTTINREAVDMTGLTAQAWTVRAGDRLVAVRPGTSGAAPYTAPGVNTPSMVSLAWPVTIFAADVVSLAWPVTIAAPTGTVVSLPWPVTIAEPATVSLAWPVQVLDAAVLGGLDGAGSWAAAPDGRWQATVNLDGVDMSARITGRVTVQIAADAARTADFAFVPAAALQPMGLIGKRVRIAFAQAGGLNAQTLFAGVIDVPTIDIDTGVVSCACHDQSQEVWSRTPRSAIDALVGGRWHEAVSGEPADNHDYMLERLQSVGASWALDALQTPRIVPWRNLPRSVIVRDADYISGSLSVELPSRDQLRTRVTCRMQYRYPKFRARRVRAQYSQPVSFFLPTTNVFPKPSYVWLTTAMVQGAAERVPGWELVDGPHIEHPQAKIYNYGTELTPAFYTISADVAPTLATGFSAEYQWRGIQTVTEDYTINVVWAAGEAMLGAPSGEEIGATIEAVFESRDWTTDPTVEPIVSAPAVGDVSALWQPPGAAEADRDECLRTLLARAWVRLWSASRSGRVRFALPCRPDLWIDTWAEVAIGNLHAAGQLVEIEHALDVGTGEAVTSCAVAVGLPGNADASMPVWVLPAAPVDSYEPPLSAYSFAIGTFVGGLPTSPPFDEASMIGLATNAEGIADPSYHYYPHQLSIRAPDLAAEDRDPRTLESVTTITVDVPTDLLEIS